MPRVGESEKLKHCRWSDCENPARLGFGYCFDHWAEIPTSLKNKLQTRIESGKSPEDTVNVRSCLAEINEWVDSEFELPERIGSEEDISF